MSFCDFNKDKYNEVGSVTSYCYAFAVAWYEILLLKYIASHYRILVSTSEHRSKAQLYAFNLRQPIPAIAVPLKGNTTVSLALQPLLYRVYDKARLELAIDYQQPLSPKLSEEDAAWILTVL